MRIIIIAVLIFAFYGVRAQKLYIETGAGLSIPVSTTLTPVSIGTDNLMSKEWIADMSVGYIHKKSNIFVNASIKYGHFSNQWYIYEHTISNLGNPLIITDKYSMQQIGLHLGKRYDFKQFYFFDYKFGVNYNSIIISSLNYTGQTQLVSKLIKNNSGNLMFDYYEYPIGIRRNSLSPTLGISIGRKIGRKVEILLNTGANIGFIPINVQIIYGRYTGNGFATVPFGTRRGDISISNGTYFYFTPSIRCYF